MEEQQHSQPHHGRRVYTEEEVQRDLAIYDEQVMKSEGFDVDSFPSLSHFYCLRMPYENPDARKGVRECSELALEHYNKDNPIKYHLVKVLKATSDCAGMETLCITFDAEDGNGDIKTFQAVVFDGIPDKRGNPDREFISVRLKPEQQSQKSTADEKPTALQH